MGVLTLCACFRLSALTSSHRPWSTGSETLIAHKVLDGFRIQWKLIKWTNEAFSVFSMSEPNEAGGPRSFPGFFSVVAGEGQALSHKECRKG